MCIFLILILQHVTDELWNLSYRFQQRLGVSGPLYVSCSTAQTVVEFQAFKLNASPIPTSLDNFVSDHIPAQDYMKTAKVIMEYLNECFLKHMDILLRCFRQPLRQSFADSADVAKIFGNLSTLYQEMRILYMELSDAMEASSDAMIASSFYVAVEESFFSEFNTYASTVLDVNCPLRIAALAKNTDLQKDLCSFSVELRQGLRRKDKPSDDPYMSSLLVGANDSGYPAQNTPQPVVICNYLYLTYKYLLPCLLQLPIYHFLHMTEAIEKLYHMCPDEREKMVLNDVLSAVYPIQQSVLHRVLNSNYSCYNNQPPAPSTSLMGNSLSNQFASQTSITSTSSKASDLSVNTVSTTSSCDDNISLCSVATLGPVSTATNNAPPPRNPVFYRTSASDTIYNLLGRQTFDGIMMHVHVRSDQAKTDLVNKTRFAQMHFHREGAIKVGYGNRHLADRYAFLFSDYLILCKRVDRRFNLPIKPNYQFTYKTIIPLSCFYVGDVVSSAEQNDYLQGMAHMDNAPFLSFSAASSLNSTQSLANSDNVSESLFLFELNYYSDPKEPQATCLTIATATAREKSQWLISFLSLQSYKVLSRYVMDNPPDEIPLRLPLVKDYIFALPDKKQYVKLELKQPGISNEVLIVKYGCMSKIIEYITHHVHFDADSLHAFFLGFRKFLTPMEFLDLLIARFNIPNPPFYAADLLDIHEQRASQRPTGERLKDAEEEKFGVDSWAKHILRKFRSTYKKKVQIRVVNVIRQWLQNPEYHDSDFKDPSMKEAVRSFLHTVRESGEGYLIKIVEAIEQRLDRPIPKLDEPQLNLEGSIELFLPVCTSFLTSMHPLEFARQVTLYEWELYRHIQFWELSGKEKTPANASNMLRCIDFSNQFTYWLIYLVVNLHQAEDRAIILERLVDLYNCFQALNNMQGCQEIKGVLNSSAVYRLKHTMEVLSRRSRESYRQLEELINADEDNLTYEEYLTQMKMKNPPCVPFSASGDQSELIRLKIKQPDVIEAPPIPTCGDGVISDDFRDFDGEPLPPPETLINFSKIYKHFKIVDYFKSFQNCPYGFHRNPRVWEFFDTLDVGALMGNPAEKRDLIEALHNRSLSVEPKNMAPLDAGQKSVRSDPSDPQTTLSELEVRLADELGNCSLEHRVDKAQALRFATQFKAKCMSSAGTSSKRPTYTNFNPPPPVPAPTPSSQSVSPTSSTLTCSEYVSFVQKNDASSSPPTLPLSVPPTPNRPSVTNVKNTSQFPPAPNLPRRKLQSECHNAPSYSQQGNLSAGSTGSTTPSNYSIPHHQHSVSAPSRSPEPTSEITEAEGHAIPSAGPPRGSSVSHTSSNLQYLTLFETAPFNASSTSASEIPPLPVRLPNPLPPLPPSSTPVISQAETAPLNAPSSSVSEVPPLPVRLHNPLPPLPPSSTPPAVPQRQRKAPPLPRRMEN